MRGCDGNVYQQGTVDFVTAQVCTVIAAGLRPDQVAIGLPAAAAAAGGGYLPPGVVNSALDCLTRASGCGRFPRRPWPPARGDDLVGELGPGRRLGLLRFGGSTPQHASLNPPRQPSGEGYLVTMSGSDSGGDLPLILASVPAADRARPLLTYYDDATGERAELSAITLENWVAKTGTSWSTNVVSGGATAPPYCFRRTGRPRPSCSGSGPRVSRRTFAVPPVTVRQRVTEEPARKVSTWSSFRGARLAGAPPAPDRFRARS